ncbi:hypothetical protein PG985_005074 [Apiospora marii]|uniref:uncharacterized protein n=1 Tax=Apiospora marii TaxID=335849 RepID=UPI003131AE6F
MAGSSSGKQYNDTTGAGAAGKKRAAVGSHDNGNAKRPHFGASTTEKALVPVADLLNVDFWGFTKLCHRHERQIGDLGNPFEALERWARHALPRSCWDDSDKQVGHWMRSESLGAAYMFQNGYCYDNGREFVTVPTYGQWLEYDGFKHFRSDEGIEWYSILKTHRLEFDTGNPAHPYLTVGSWTMSRFGKPVIVGKDNNFYQSVLDAFRERNPATISHDKEIEVPIKYLTMISDLEQEPPRPDSRDMYEYGPYLRLVGGSAHFTSSQKPSVPEKMNIDHPEHSNISEAKSVSASSSKEATAVPSNGGQRPVSEKTHTTWIPPAPSPPHTPEKPRTAPTKASHGLATPSSSGSAGPNKTIRGPLNGNAQQGPTTAPGKEKNTYAGPVTGHSNNYNTGLATPEKDQKTKPSQSASIFTASRHTVAPSTADRPTAAPSATGRPTATPSPASRPTATPSVASRLATTRSAAAATQPAATHPVATPAATRAASTATGTKATAHAEREPEGEKHISGTGGSAKVSNNFPTIYKGPQAASKAPTSTGTKAQQFGATGSFSSAKTAQNKDDATADATSEILSVAQETAFHRASIEAQLSAEVAAQRVQTANTNVKAITQPQELHGKSQGLSFGVEMEFMIPVVLEEERDGTDIDDELLPSLNVIPFVPGEDRKKYSDANPGADMEVRDWVEEKLRSTLLDLRVPVIDSSGDLINANAVSERVSAERSYWGWKIVNDGSVMIPQSVDYAYRGGKTRWVSLELISPAYWATPKNLGEIRRVVSALSGQLRVLTPKTGGLHVHVGRGKSSFGLGELKRLAGLCYAAGPLLSQLHPKSRHGNLYCQSNRLYSNLAHGMTMEEAIAARSGSQGVGNHDDGEVPQVPHANPMCLGPATEESGQRPADTPRFQRMVPRGDLPREELSAKEYRRWELNDNSVSNTMDSPRDVVPAINEMWRAPTPTDLVAVFQTYNSKYYAYSMARYVSEDYACRNDSVGVYFTSLPDDVAAGSHDSNSSSAMAEDGDNSSSRSRRSSAFAPNAFSDTASRHSSTAGQHVKSETVEFRQAAATLDPDSVVAWVRVVVNLTCVAVHSRMEEFSRLVHCCAKAEREPAWYDAFDLLVDLGMPRTAQFIQTSMLSRKTRTPWADLPEKEALMPSGGNGAD